MSMGHDDVINDPVAISVCYDRRGCELTKYNNIGARRMGDIIRSVS